MQKLFFLLISSLSLLAGCGYTMQEGDKKMPELKELDQYFVYPYKLPPLPYAYDALEPHIDKLTMELHHDKHHQAYIDKANKALEKYPELQKRTVLELLKNTEMLPEDIKQEFINNGGGHLNHSLFWYWMTPHGGGQPGGKLAEAINQTFGSFEKFKEKFDEAAKGRFGSGWAWLSVDSNKRLVISSTANQDTPYSAGLTPILGLDVWEHAYYLKYQNKRPEYITNWWYTVNWAPVEQVYEQLIK